MTCLSCKSGMCSFHSWEWELREPRRCPCYVVSEKRAPLWLILLETTMRTSGFIMLLNHSPYFFLLLPELSLSLFLCSPSVIGSSHFTFFLSYLLQFLWNSRKAGLPQSVRWWSSDKAVPVVSLPLQADSMELSVVQISVRAVLTGNNPGTLFACYSGILHCQGCIVWFPLSGFYFDIKNQSEQKYIVAIQKNNSSSVLNEWGNWDGIKEMSSLQYAQTSEWEGFLNKIIPQSHFRLVASISETSGRAGRSRTANTGSLEATLRVWNHTDAWAVDLCLGRTDRKSRSHMLTSELEILISWRSRT